MTQEAMKIWLSAFPSCQHSPGEADQNLHADEALKPTFYLAVAAAIAFIGAGHQRRGAHRDAHGQR
jgi:hypothetical protein